MKCVVPGCDNEALDPPLVRRYPNGTETRFPVCEDHRSVAEDG